MKDKDKERLAKVVRLKLLEFLNWTRLYGWRGLEVHGQGCRLSSAGGLWTGLRVLGRGCMVVCEVAGATGSACCPVVRRGGRHLSLAQWSEHPAVVALRHVNCDVTSNQREREGKGEGRGWRGGLDREAKENASGRPGVGRYTASERLNNDSVSNN